MKVFDDFKNKQKKFMNWKFIQCTILWDKTQMFKKFPSGKINNTKNELFFLLRARKHQAFTFNSPFSYKLWSTSFLSLKVGMRFYIIDSVSFFIKVYILAQQKAWTLWFYNVIVAFKTKIIEKPLTLLFPDLEQIATRSFKVQLYLRELELPKYWRGDEVFKLRKSKIWIRQFFSIVMSFISLIDLKKIH